MKAKAKTRAEAYGKRNAYTCEKCAKVVITEDLEEGVTPFLIGCLATEGCMGMMRSACYRVTGPEIRPHYHWRKPTKQEYKAMSKPMKQHIDQGGLEIYPVVNVEPRSLKPRPL